MYQIGQQVDWSTPNAPHPFSGICRRYSARDAFTRQLLDDEVGDFRAAVLHSAKVAIDFEAEVTSASDDFFDLSDGPVIALGLTPGTTCCYEATERWALEQPKVASLQATHFPGITSGNTGSDAGAISAFTPSQSGLGLLTPGNSLIYGTYGMTHAAGVVHGLTITQRWSLTEHRPTPAGVIPGVNAHGYTRTIELLLLATGAQPAKGTTLTITGAPDHAGGYRIEGSDLMFEDKREKMYQVRAFWIPPFAS